MNSPTTSIARLRDGGSTWALGGLSGDDTALERLSAVLLSRWQPGDRLVVLGNMLGAAGDPVRALDLMLLLRRRLLARPGAEVEDFVFLRGAQEEMWHKVLQLQFAMSPLDVLDWMLARGLMATIEAYGHSVAEGRIASRNGPSAIARWTASLRQRHTQQPGHPDLLNSLARAAISADGRIVFAAAGADPARPLDEQADAFWWNATSDNALDDALGRAGDGGWPAIDRLVRGTGPASNVANENGRVLTVARDQPTLVALDADGAVLERIEP
jgi:serine/threonine protein phosphatase 1